MHSQPYNVQTVVEQHSQHRGGAIHVFGPKISLSDSRLRLGVGYIAWKWIVISLESQMVSCYKNKIVQAGVSNRMHQCLIFLVLNVHIHAYLGSRGKPFF
jgi:hypothetical protein